MSSPHCVHANVIFGRTSEVLAIVFLDLLDSFSTSGSGSGPNPRHSDYEPLALPPELSLGL